MTKKEIEDYSRQTGVPENEINENLDRFDKGGSFLVDDRAYDSYINGKPYIGYDDNTCYIMPSDELDKIIEESNGDIHYIEDQLGFERGHFGDGPIHRVDIPGPYNHNVRMADGKEKGGNAYFNTSPDENGNMPNVHAEETRLPAPDRPDKKIPVYDTTKNDPAELAKLNGEYYDEKGNYHEPNIKGYKGEVSGGKHESVVDRVQNSPPYVQHSTYSGFNQNKPPEHNKDSGGYQLMLGPGSNPTDGGHDDHTPPPVGGYSPDNNNAPPGGSVKPLDDEPSNDGAKPDNDPGESGAPSEDPGDTPGEGGEPSAEPGNEPGEGGEPGEEPGNEPGEGGEPSAEPGNEPGEGGEPSEEPGN